MRIFYAAFLGADTTRLFADLLDEVARGLPGTLRPPPAGSAHLTLVFLGEVGPEDVERCREILSSEPAPAAVPISLAHPRVLYGRGSPRLVLTDVVRGAREVASIQRSLRERLLEEFPQKELKLTPPHATLARFGKGQRREAGRRVEKALLGSAAGGIFTEQTVAEISLVRSTLTPSGPVYEVLERRRLPPVTAE
jgi:2'-5' RNA ligase